jgi:hypothetical protein
MPLTFAATVTRIFENKVRKHISGAGPDAVFTTDSAGWYIRLSDEISLFCGMTKPEFEVGETVLLTLKRSPNANPQR